MKSYTPPHKPSTYFFLSKSTYERSPESQMARHQNELQVVASKDIDSGFGGGFRVVVAKGAHGLIVGIEGTSSLANWLFDASLPFSERRGFLSKINTYLQSVSDSQGIPIVGFTGHSSGATLCDRMIKTFFSECHGVFFNGYAINNRENYRNMRTSEDELTSYTTKTVTTAFNTLAHAIGVPLHIALAIANQTRLSQYETVFAGSHSIDHFAKLGLQEDWSSITRNGKKANEFKTLLMTTVKKVTHILKPTSWFGKGKHKTREHARKIDDIAGDISASQNAVQARSVPDTAIHENQETLKGRIAALHSDIGFIMKKIEHLKARRKKRKISHNEYRNAKAALMSSLKAAQVELDKATTIENNLNTPLSDLQHAIDTTPHNKPHIKATLILLYELRHDQADTAYIADLQKALELDDPEERLRALQKIKPPPKKAEAHQQLLELSEDQAESSFKKRTLSELDYVEYINNKSVRATCKSLKSFIEGNELPEELKGKLKEILEKIEAGDLNSAAKEAQALPRETIEENGLTQTLDAISGCAECKTAISLAREKQAQITSLESMIAEGNLTEARALAKSLKASYADDDILVAICDEAISRGYIDLSIKVAQSINLSLQVGQIFSARMQSDATFKRVFDAFAIAHRLAPDIVNTSFLLPIALPYTDTNVVFNHFVLPEIKKTASEVKTLILAINPLKANELSLEQVSLLVNAAFSAYSMSPSGKQNQAALHTLGQSMQVFNAGMSFGRYASHSALQALAEKGSEEWAKQAALAQSHKVQGLTMAVDSAYDLFCSSVRHLLSVGQLPESANAYLSRDVFGSLFKTAVVAGAASTAAASAAAPIAAAGLLTTAAKQIVRNYEEEAMQAMMENIKVFVAEEELEQAGTSLNKLKAMLRKPDSADYRLLAQTRRLFNYQRTPGLELDEKDAPAFAEAKLFAYQTEVQLHALTLANLIQKYRAEKNEPERTNTSTNSLDEKKEILVRAIRDANQAVAELTTLHQDNKVERGFSATNILPALLIRFEMAADISEFELGASRLESLPLIKNRQSLRNELNHIRKIIIETLADEALDSSLRGLNQVSTRIITGWLSASVKLLQQPETHAQGLDTLNTALECESSWDCCKEDEQQLSVAMLAAANAYLLLANPFKALEYLDSVPECYREKDFWMLRNKALLRLLASDGLVSAQAKNCLHSMLFVTLTQLIHALREEIDEVKADASIDLPQKVTAIAEITKSLERFSATNEALKSLSTNEIMKNTPTWHNLVQGCLSEGYLHQKGYQGRAASIISTSMHSTLARQYEEQKLMEIKGFFERYVNSAKDICGEQDEAHQQLMTGFKLGPHRG